MSDLQFMPVNEPIAQCEHINILTLNQLVEGSSPSRGTNFTSVFSGLN